MEVPAGYAIRSDGLYEHQWDWLVKYAKTHSTNGRAMEVAEAKRMGIQWFMDAVDAATLVAVVTPEQDADFDKLVSANQVKKTNSKSTQVRKTKTKE